MNQRQQTSSDEEFVDALYTTLLKRPADPAGRAFYVARLEQGISRIELTREIATSATIKEAPAKRTALDAAALSCVPATIAIVR